MSVRVALATWAFGTRKRVQVIHRIDKATVQAVICEADHEPGVGYVLLFAPTADCPAVGDRGTFVAVICEADDEPGVGYALLFAPTADCPAVGDRGAIVYTRGGPLGGHWKFEAGS